jgi:hypothetical protein
VVLGDLSFEAADVVLEALVAVLFDTFYLFQ